MKKYDKNSKSETSRAKAQNEKILFETKLEKIYVVAEGRVIMIVSCKKTFHRTKTNV